MSGFAAESTSLAIGKSIIHSRKGCRWLVGAFQGVTPSYSRAIEFAIYCGEPIQIIEMVIGEGEVVGFFRKA